jgi:selenocysteine lyase/cysteine desulfurase
LVTCNLEHPAIDNPANVLEERRGVIVKKVALPPGGGEEEVMALLGEAITPRTRIVALSHIQFSCGLRLPVKAIAEIAHERGALVFLDGAQTAGHIAIDVHDLDADFYAVSGQKWLLGPNGTGAMYISAQHNRDFEPLFSTHAIADRQAASRPGAGRTLGRYRLASQSPALVAGFTTAISLLGEIGMDTVEAHVNALAQRLRDGIEAIDGCSLTGPKSGSCASGLVTVEVEGWEPGQVVGELWSKFRIAARSVGYPSAVRFTCASFNNAADIDAAIEALRDIVRRSPPADAADPTAGH